MRDEILLQELLESETEEDAVRGLPPDARQIISRVGRGFGPSGADAVPVL